MTYTENLPVVGVDAGKSNLVLELAEPGCSTRKKREVKNEYDSWCRLNNWLKTLGHQRVIVCMEATGRYSEPFAAYMYAAGHLVFVVNGNRINKYAESLGLLGKSDKADAHAIAEFALKHSEILRLWEPLSEARAQLRDIRTHLIGLKKAKQALVSRGDAVGDKDISESCLGLVKNIEEEIERFLRKAAQIIAADEELSRQQKILETIIGYGRAISVGLITHIDFTKFRSGREVNRFIGHVPKRKQSGTSLNTYGHLAREGPSELRGLLWCGARAAIQFDPSIREYANRLYGRGKGPDTVRVAVAAKMIRRAHALIKKGVEYDPHYKSELVSA